MAVLPMPSNDALWRATSTTAWSRAKVLQSYSSGNVIECVRKILDGKVYIGPVSSFGLLSLIGCLLGHICVHERFSVEKDSPSLNQDFAADMERSLHEWESLWRRHPHAERVPSKHGDPLMVDCLALLGSAYYHLYMGRELYLLKSIACDPGCPFPLPRLQLRAEVVKAVKYAASSWLVRAKLGVAHLQRTAALEFGCHNLVTAYESGRLSGLPPFSNLLPS